MTDPEGIWYTAVTGIWQTVWLEPVPAASVEGYKAVPDLDAGVLRLTVEGRGTRGTDTIRRRGEGRGYGRRRGRGNGRRRA